MLRLVLSFFLLCLPAAYAQESHNPEPFGAWVQEFRQEAGQEGISAALLDAALSDLAPLPEVIELDRKQPESTLTFSTYMQKVVPQARIDKARRLYRENRALLERIGEKYGVQPRFIVALWAVESNFGERMGDFEIVPALATLAYDGRRSVYFRKELLNALKIIDGGHIALHEMTGSWAGAMGQSQFMPTSFLNFAVDEDGDGKKDIWHSRADVFGSIANYLSREGWNDAETWGRQVKIPASLTDPALFDIKAEKPVAAWRKLGVRKENGAKLPASDIAASLISVERDKGGKPYYLIYNNYKVLLKWNRSRYFATAVGTLADRIGEGIK